MFVLMVGLFNKVINKLLVRMFFVFVKVIILLLV